MTALRRFARLVVLGCLTLAMAPSPQAQRSASGEAALASLPPEVRLRKLHLVRPDLIPYPIAYEVCC